MGTSIQNFQNKVWRYYDSSKRQLPWRQVKPDGTIDAYKILVSELMLQQTQVGRVLAKYESFLFKFPNITALASAPLSEVLVQWSGLGYNRRAKYLHDAAQTLSGQSSEWGYDKLINIKGIAHNTAAAILVYAYNRRYVFIETNIRTVFIDEFFNNHTRVSDKEIIELVEKTLPDINTGLVRSASKRPSSQQQNYREWYWALMDYGSHLKATSGNSANRSVLYRRQSTFAGSKRQVRGKVIQLLQKRDYSETELINLLSDERSADVVSELLKEGLISRRGNEITLGS